MKPLLPLAALAALSAAAAQNVAEIPAMTVPTSVIDMDSVGPVGTTTVAALRTAGSNGGAPLADLVLTPSAAVAGFYNTNPQLGRALARNATNQLVLLNPLSNFQSFDAQIRLQLPAFEFGIAVGDWIEGMFLDFYYQNTLIGSIESSDYTTPNAKFFRAGQPFDEVRVRAERPDGNWVIPQLHLQQSSTTWSAFGAGCAGSSGVPALQLLAPPSIGTTYRLQVVNMPVAGGFMFVVFGFSDTDLPGFGPLPFDMAPFGAPGCFLLCDVVAINLIVQAGGSAQYSLAIPPNIGLLGLEFFNQAYVSDAPANALGFTTSNGARAVIG